MKIYDVIIIGAGPAGMTAGIYSARKKLSTAIISKDIGGQMAWSGIIENYTGITSIKGWEITEEFHKHSKEQGVHFISDGISNLEKKNNLFYIKGNKEEYISKSVIVASGKNPKMLRVPGEKEFLNKGVVYCATCDGPLYADKRVAIVGGGSSALDAAAQLANIASKVYIINKNDKMKGDLALLDRVKSYENVEFIFNSLTQEIKGNSFVEEIFYLREDKIESKRVDGVFVQIGLIPNSQYIDIVNKNEYGEITVDNECQTSIPGVFAAGDVTDVFEKQIVIAAGEGSKAALSCFKYLSTN